MGPLRRYGWALANRLPQLLLRAEGLAELAAALVLYFHADYGWLPFVVLILVPDVSIAAYAFGPRTGAIVYDLLHTEVFAITLGAAGVVAGSAGLTMVALIWLAHIGADRLLGYGLKYPSAFKETHFSRV
ncbi:MAG TPA: DUF4260 domain-containing protein [Gaiellaceae bacterium]|nr:DUF4260 domain-containing protein [Gaiellaceae bacterium]